MMMMMIQLLLFEMLKRQWTWAAGTRGCGRLHRAWNTLVCCSNWSSRRVSAILRCQRRQRWCYSDGCLCTTACCEHS